MRKSIDLTVSRAGIKLCIRKNTHQYPLQVNLGSSNLSTEDGRYQQFGQMQNSVSLESFEKELVLPTTKSELNKKETFENNDYNQYQENAQNDDIVNSQKSITKTSSNNLNNNYDDNNSSGKNVRFYLEKDQQNNSSVDYTSETENSLTSSDYDADDEDIEINTTNLTKSENECMTHLCELLNKNININSEEKSLELRQFTESIFLDDLYNTTGRDLNISKKKFDKFLQRMCQAQSKETGRQKRSSNTSPQLALLIPVIDEEVNESDNPSVRLKRCIRKSCHKSLCQSLGCYAQKNKYATDNPDISYETKNREAATNRKIPFVQSFDSTSHNAPSYPSENNSGKIPIHHFKPASKHKLRRNHKENDISQNKLPKLLVPNKGRKYDESDESQDRSSFYDSSASLQTHLAGRANHLKKLLAESRERSRNLKKLQPWNTQQQTTNHFPHETTGNPINPADEKHEVKMVKNNDDEYLLPNEIKQKQSEVFVNENQDKFYSKFESEQQSGSIQTMPPASLKQEHGTMGVEPMDEVGFNPTYSETGNNIPYSSLHPPDNLFQQSNHDSVERYSTSTYLLPRQVYETNTEGGLHPENYNSKTKDSSKFHNLYSIDNEKIQLPVELNNSSSVLRANSQYAITTPLQLEKESTRSENSDILQKVNLQDIYKNLPPNYEFSAGQWIRVQPSESISIHSGKIKPAYEGKERASKDFTEYDNNSLYSQLSNESKNNVKIEVTTGSDAHDNLIPTQILTKNTNNFEKTITNLADKDLGIYRSQSNNAPTELFTYMKTDNEGNIRTAPYSDQDEAKQLSLTNYNSMHSTDQLTTPFSLTENMKGNEDILEKIIDVAKEQIPLSLKTLSSNLQEENPFRSDLEKQLQRNDELYSHKYQHNLQNHENNNQKQTANIPHLMDDSYLKKSNEIQNNTSNEKHITHHFNNKGELTTSLWRTSNTEAEIPDTNTYHIPHESESKRNRFNKVSNKIGKHESKLNKNQESVDDDISNIYSGHERTELNSKEQSQLKVPHKLSNFDDLQFTKTGQTTEQKISQTQDNKIPYYDFKKFHSDSNLDNNNMNETWNGTSHTVIDILTKMLENPEQISNIENTTPYYNAGRIFTSVPDKVPSLTEETSLDTQHSETEDAQVPNSQATEIIETNSELRKQSPSQWYVEDNNAFQKHHSISKDYPNHTKQSQRADQSSIEDDTEMFPLDGDKESINQLGTFVSQKSPISQNEKENVFVHKTNNLPHNFTLKAMPTKDDVNEQNEYSGTMLLVDPNTGTVTETIPVAGRFLTLNSERDEVHPIGVPTQSHQPHTLKYLQPHSQESYPSTSYREESFETNYPHEILTDHSYSPLQFIQSTPHSIVRKNKWGEFDFPSQKSHLNQKEEITNAFAKKMDIGVPAISAPQSPIYSTQRNRFAEPQEKETQIEPFARGQTPHLPSKDMDNNSQVRNSQISLKIPPEVNVTCLTKDLPCEIAKDDVYSNFFTIMLEEMHKFGGENCTQNCTNSKIIPACENCIKKLIYDKVNDSSMNESVKEYAVHHCPQLEATNNNFDSASTQSSTSPYTKCKYKFIADLTSLFGLWLRAITNSR